MATISDSIRSSSLNLGEINKSLKETKITISSVNDSVTTISKNIANNTRIKNDLFMKSNLLDSRRREASRRQEIEDQIESKKVSIDTKSGLAFTSRLTGSPLSRLLGFLGFITSGWIVRNLPTWIFMGNEFISRIQRFGGSMNIMVGNIQILMNFFGDALKNSLNAILSLDFNEFTEGSVLESFQGITSTIEKLGDNFTDIFNIFRAPLTQSMETGQQGPGLGDTQPETMFPGVTQESNVTGVHKQALDVIAKYESSIDRAGNGYNAMNQGGEGMSNIYGSGSSTSLLGKALTQMTVAEIMDRQRKNKQYSGANKIGIFAAGRYQITPDTLKGIVDAGIIKITDTFDQQTQDKAALYLIKTRGIQPWGWDAASKARFSGSEQALIEKARITPVSTPTTSTSTSISTGLSGPATFIQGNTGRSSGEHFHIGPDLPYYGKPEGYVVAREGAFVIAKNLMARKIPFTFSNWWKTSSFWYTGGNPKSDSELREAIQKEQVAHTTRKTGSSFAGIDISAPSGTRLPGILDVKYIENGFGVQGKISGTNAFVGHGAYGSTSGTASNTTLGSISQTSTSQSYSPPPLPLSQIGSANSQASAVLMSITPERQGSNVVLVDTTRPQIPQSAQMTPPPIPPPVSIDEFKLLNNFIKNKLLLDLTYL